MISRFEQFGPACVGRDLERDEFRAFLGGTELGIGLDVCVIRGLGGIGKTTLARAVANDFLGSGDGRSAFLVDCVTLPPHPDVASLLRALETDATGPTPLRDAAARLDHIAALVGSANQPPDTDDVDATVWHDTKRFALNLITFFSSAAIEKYAFNQLATGSSSTVLSGVQAIASARSALNQIVRCLKAQQRMSEDEAAVALDLETYVSEVLAEYFLTITNGDRLAIIFDKAENLTDRLFRFLQLLDDAARRSELKLTAVLAGRLVRLPAPDGSQLPVRAFLEAISLPSLDIELTPFSTQQVQELLVTTRRRFHPDHDAGEPPLWVAEAVTATSGGLPLWAASIAEALFALGPDPWQRDDATVGRLVMADGDLFETIARIFRELNLDGGTSAFPLLVTLAVAAPDTPNDVICSIAGTSTEVLKEVSRQFSFMHGERLHDSARAILRHFLITRSDGAEDVRGLATELQQWLSREAPEGSPLGPGQEWTKYIPDVIELAFWGSIDEGVRKTVDYLLMGLSTGRSWIGPLVERASWFVEHEPPSEQLRHLLATCVRAGLPVILGYTLTQNLSDERAGAIRSAAIDGTQARPEFDSSYGRYLDEVERQLKQAEVVISPEARAGLHSARLFWLVKHGFDDEAFDLALISAKEMDESPPDAPIRRHVGRSLSLLIDAFANSVSTESKDNRERRFSEIDQLVVALTRVDPLDSASVLGNLARKLGPRGVTDSALDQLLEVRNELPDSTRFREDLGHALLDQGRFTDAERVFREGLARNPEWIHGTVGRVEALLGLGAVDDAADILSAQVKLIHSAGDLSAADQDDVATLVTSALFTFLVSGRQEDMRAVALLGLAPSDYGELLVALVDDDPLVALDCTERYIGDVSDPADLAPEAAIALSRNARFNEAHDAIQTWYGMKRSAILQAKDTLLLQAAIRAGWMRDTDLPALRTGHED